MNNLLHEHNVVIVGGCGHVGLPLGVKFALAGAKTTLLDIDDNAIAQVNAGQFPFLERGGDAQLSQALAAGMRATNEPEVCASADVIVFVVGTPVDRHLNSRISDVLSVIDAYVPHFRPGALVIMRSTLFPGTMRHLNERLHARGTRLHLAFCPERVAQGYALDEIDTLPQIVSAFDDDSFKAAYELFAPLAPSILRLEPLEAELAKLMTNSWRYLEFAIANQFYMIAETSGVDFFKIYQAICYEYPRAKGYKSPGFSAGPCLFKDTMQLASYVNHQFYLGHAAMLVNEGLATIAARKAVEALGGSAWGKVIGLLGMTFKPNNDDTRESLSFKVKKAVEFEGATVITHDPYLSDSTPLGELCLKSDVIILCTPHREYRELKFEQPIVDVWGSYEQPELEIHPGR